MKEKMSLSIVLVILLSFSSGILLKGQNNSKSWTKLEKSFKKVDISEGSRLIKLRKSRKEVWDFALSAPKFGMNEKRPLVIALHWAGGEGTYKQFSSCLANPGLESLRAFIISPESESDQWISEKNQKKVLGLVELAKNNWPIDTNRIYIIGYSNGGIGSWFFAHKFPDVFDAAVPVASYYKTGGDIINIPMYIIHGELDELFAINKTRFWYIQSKKSGSDMQFVEAAGLSHFEACKYIDYLKDAAKWLDSLNIK